MTTPMAFRATYADWKLIKTRGVVQVVMEVPLADSDLAYDVLGGMPNPAHEMWFGIAPIKIPVERKEASPAPRQEVNPRQPDGGKRDWRELQPQQQAGIRCGEPTFVAFLKEKRPDDWAAATDAAECVRLICGVHSRVELGTDHRARVIWHQLDTEYAAWKALENA